MWTQQPKNLAAKHIPHSAMIVVFTGSTKHMPGTVSDVPRNNIPNCTELHALNMRYTGLSLSTFKNQISGNVTLLALIGGGQLNSWWEKLRLKGNFPFSMTVGPSKRQGCGNPIQPQVPRGWSILFSSTSDHHKSLSPDTLIHCTLCLDTTKATWLWITSWLQYSSCAPY